MGCEGDWELVSDQAVYITSHNLEVAQTSGRTSCGMRALTLFDSDGLRTPEAACECRRADWVALARTGITRRAAVLADIVVALIIAKDIATRA